MDSSPPPVPFRNITISSTSSSGATTLANALSDYLSWPIKNVVSQAMRAYLRERQLPMSAGEQVPDQIHTTLDMQVKELMGTAQHIIFSGRTTGWLAQDFPDIFKIFVTADQGARIERYAHREHLSEAEARHEIESRDSQDWQRYQRLYDIDYTDPVWYDLVVDTTTADAAKTFAIAKQALTPQDERR